MTDGPLGGEQSNIHPVTPPLNIPRRDPGALLPSPEIDPISIAGPIAYVPPSPESNPPLWGISENKSSGVTGTNQNDGAGIRGISVNGDGVLGEGGTNGVHGESTKAQHSGVWANNSGGGYGVTGTSDASGGIGVYGRGKAWAGKFDGNVRVSGDIEVSGDIRLANADCAEDFDIAGLEKIEPGTVMAIDAEGALRPSDRPYDKRVAGVISGAGLYRPGLILDKQESSKNRMPIALMGKVYCKVDASYGAIEVGDLLTTSLTPGYAMKASDPTKAFGAVLGKALRPLQAGKTLIPVLVALQ